MKHLIDSCIISVMESMSEISIQSSLPIIPASTESPNLTETYINQPKTVKIPLSELKKVAYTDLGTSLGDVTGVPEILGKVVPCLAAINALGQIDFGPDVGIKAFQSIFLVFGSYQAGLKILYDRYSRVIEKPTFSLAYPELKKEVPIDKVEEMLKDGARGVFGLRNLPEDPKPSSSFESEWRSRLYPLSNYKKHIFELSTQKLESQEDADFVLRIVLGSPDPEIKLQGIDILLQKCKPFLKDKIVDQTSFESNLEEVVVKKLKKEWWGISTENNPEILDNIKQDKLFENSQKIYEKISSNIDLPKTLIPLLKLFVLRKMTDEISLGRIPLPDDEELTTKIFSEFDSRMQKLNVLENERKYSPEDATVGFEMQPSRSGNSKELTLTKMDISQVKKLTKYAGLKWQNDMPFEIAFPPTRTPIVQALMLIEACNLTGITVDQLGLQINFGGLTKNENIKALQRIMLIEGRLQPKNNISVLGNWWNLGSAQKGEINKRDLDTDAVLITPNDKNHPEFKSVGEYRTPIFADNWFSFYRGLLNAHNLASSAKAFERQQRGYSLTENEGKKAKLFSQTKEQLTAICRENDLPPIDANWSRKNWKLFGNLLGFKVFQNASINKAPMRDI